MMSLLYTPPFDPIDTRVRSHVLLAAIKLKRPDLIPRLMRKCSDNQALKRSKQNGKLQFAMALLYSTLTCTSQAGEFL